jgi:hypothetical protein
VTANLIVDCREVLDTGYLKRYRGGVTESMAKFHSQAIVEWDEVALGGSRAAHSR